MLNRLRGLQVEVLTPKDTQVREDFLRKAFVNEQQSFL